MTEKDKVNILVIYAEPHLQRAVSLPADWTIRQAMAEAHKELESHLNTQLHGLPSRISIDEDCDDFFPQSDPDAQLSTLQGLKTLICWPKGPSDQTPSPLFDELVKRQQSVNPAAPTHPAIAPTEATQHAVSVPVGASEQVPATSPPLIAILEQKIALQEQLVRGLAARVTLLESQLEASRRAAASGA